MTNVDPPLRAGPWTWRCLPAASPGRAGVGDVQLWHEALSLPVLDFAAGAWALDAPEFAVDGAELRFDVVALANRARFRVTIDLAAGRWRSAGEPRGLPAAVLQQRFGGAGAVAAWPVVIVDPAPAATPPAIAAASANPSGEGAGERADEPARPVAVVPATPSPPSATEPTAEPLPDDVPPPPATSADGRWRFEFAVAPPRERDAAGRFRSYCWFVLHDAHAAAAFDSRTTGDLCWPAGRWLRLVRGPGAATWFVVDLQQGVFWLENFREPLGPERPLDELAAALRRS
jgi:hypothetical protein